MKTPLFAALTASLAALGHAQSPPPQAVIAEQSRSRPVVMERAEQWTMRSKAGRSFEISIARPSAAAPASGYPVMYVLDPSSDAEAENRTLDLTPPTDPANLPPGMPNGWGATGGNDAFLSFLVDELKPAVAVIPAYLARGARFTLNGWFE